MNADIPFVSSDLVDGKYTLQDTRIIDFIVEDNEGNLVSPTRSYLSNGSTEVDFNGWDIVGTWYFRLVPVEAGADAEPGLELDEFMFRMYLLRGNGRYLPYQGKRPSFPVNQEKKAPILGNQFYASGKEQLISGEVVPVIIPAFGEMRQYVGTSIITAGSEGVLYQFQVYRDNTIVFDVNQDSSNYPPTSVNKGNVFYFPQNLPSRYDKTSPRYSYFWRVRASYKIEDPNGDLYWSSWSYSFPFTVNIPPGTPFDLSISSGIS